MDVIKYVSVENFRSIRSLILDGLASYVPLMGLNSAGKSNVLRALNLFFNNYVDEERASLRLSSDYSGFAPRGKKRTVTVMVGLSLNGDIRVRGVDEFEKSHSIQDVIYIRRSWMRGAVQDSVVDSFEFGASPETLQVATSDEALVLQTYIRAVRFVYVPNHARPSELIRAELEPLRPDLVRRLRGTKAFKDSNVPDLMAALVGMGSAMFGGVSTSVQRGLPSTTLAADLPSDFGDLVFSVGVNAISAGGVSRAPEFEGSGAQSFMLLHILDLADRSRRSSDFGWTQASVWAIEEPESFLHAGLRARFSTDLANYALDSRRQVIVTTHQDEFARVAEYVWTAEMTEEGTQIQRLAARDAIAEATRREITTFRHPLFSHTDQPLVIVEGRYDAVHLRAALTHLDVRIRWRLVAPSEIFDADAGGDGVLEYLKYNSQAIASRPDAAPVIVLRDWEDKKKPQYDKALKHHEYSTCIIADGTLVNPELDESFVGIERYLSTDLLTSVIPIESIGLEHGGDHARKSIKRDVLEEWKPKLAQAVQDGADPGEYMLGLAQWLDGKVVGVLNGIPATSFF
ncbi:hypothetical protein [Kribbella sp. NPDC004536]|uniref:hypothetical protein n=1 Tax=Kribbella sp. NPDC004536 TaxID=3364106 RepID=UPI0036BF7111